MATDIEIDREGWPVHQPLCDDAPIPGGPWHYSGCSDDRPRVKPDGTCEDCGGKACPVCGQELCQTEITCAIEQARRAQQLYDRRNNVQLDLTISE